MDSQRSPARSSRIVSLHGAYLAAVAMAGMVGLGTGTADAIASRQNQVMMIDRKTVGIPQRLQRFLAPTYTGESGTHGYRPHPNAYSNITPNYKRGRRRRRDNHPGRSRRK